MKAIFFLSATLTLSGCANSILEGNSSFLASTRQNISRDSTDCKGWVIVQQAESPAAENRTQTLNRNANNTANRSLATLYNRCMTQRGWSYEAIAAQNDAYKKEVELQARTFFEKFPQYLNAPDEEARLSNEFERALNDPNNQGLSLYQILLVAHTQLQTQQ
ncbi:hypothetical protein [Aeromonas cavernicola]|uniref:Lipoprotein n=1 Tax=Aeromonas cavernicola TaxID=1006623 RepID=A0A2H9U1Z0_9GAMM|nr:hypothetical protein [Aeromonas cavernicola]PJG58086.1 hypothetical protein CUC53_14470 [Aeromonas cavernicola]